MAIEELNRHFPGTYNASLIIEADEPGMLTDPEVATSVAVLQELWDGIDVVGQSVSYVDVVRQGTASNTVPDDQEAIERSLESAASSPNRGLIAGLM